MVYVIVVKRKDIKRIFVQSNNLVKMRMETAATTLEVRRIGSRELATTAENSVIDHKTVGKRKKTNTNVLKTSNQKVRTMRMAAKK